MTIFRVRTTILKNRILIESLRCPSVKIICLEMIISCSSEKNQVSKLTQPQDTSIYKYFFLHFVLNQSYGTPKIAMFNIVINILNILSVITILLLLAFQISQIHLISGVTVTQYDTPVDNRHLFKPSMIYVVIISEF